MSNGVKVINMVPSDMKKALMKRTVDAVCVWNPTYEAILTQLSDVKPYGRFATADGEPCRLMS